MDFNIVNFSRFSVLFVSENPSREKKNNKIISLSFFSYKFFFFTFSSRRFDARTDFMIVVFRYDETSQTHYAIEAMGVRLSAECDCRS